MLTGPTEGSADERLEAVRACVGRVKELIKAQQDADIAQARQEAVYAQPMPPHLRVQSIAVGR